MIEGRRCIQMDPTLGRLIGCRWKSYNDADWLMMKNIETEMQWLFVFIWPKNKYGALDIVWIAKQIPSYL